MKHYRLTSAAVVALAIVAVPLFADVAQSQAPNAYPVSGFITEYEREHPQHPPLADVELVTAGIAEPGKTLNASEINNVCREIVAFFNSRGIIGVFVFVDPADIDASGVDRRAGRTTLRLVIRTSKVAKVRTVAAGGRLGEQDDKINNRAHDRIARLSPIDPDKGDLLRKDIIERYVHLLNRRPGRQVDVAVTAGDQPGQVGIDYLVAENKPWFVYLQVSNTGTETTSHWRERIGFVHNQLFGQDDTLQIDINTTMFDESNVGYASYEAPVFDINRLRWRAYGLYGKYRAREVGIGENLEANSREWFAGGELIANLFQHEQLFVDGIIGARWRRISLDNKTANSKGDEDFCLPYIGLRIERYLDTSNTAAAIMFERNAAGIAATNGSQMERLGRLQTNREWTVMTWDMNHSFFLEPVFNRRRWLNADPNNRAATLAHELAMTFKGQHSFESRLMPQAQGVIGGFYNVRGYPQSVIAADSALIGNLEYRYHIPRSFPVDLKPKMKFFGRPFRVAPQQPYGRPDWDLVFRTFFDFGRVMYANRNNVEFNRTIASWGIGLELQVSKNLNIRCDWGLALRAVEDVTEEVDYGDNQFHIMVTLLY